MTKLLATCAGVLAAAQLIARPSTAQPPRAPTQKEFALREQQASGVPYQVLFAEKEWAGADVLVPMLSSDQSAVRLAAIAAVARLEDPGTLPALIAAGARGPFIAQALHGFDPTNAPDLIAEAANAVSGSAAGRLRYLTAAQVHAVERSLAIAAEHTKNDRTRATDYGDALLGLEWLARLNQRVTRFEDATLETLRHAIANTALNDEGLAARQHAFTALINAGAVDPDSEKAALNDQVGSVRRLAVAVLAGAGGGLDDAARVGFIESALRDDSPSVRYEAVKAYLRRGVQTGGCQPIVDRISDDDTHVMLAAIDALGGQCKDDSDITTRLVAEAITPSSANWHRPTHAFLALAMRARDRAAASMDAFATHPNWWVRMYAARAAAAMEDTAWLGKLSADVNDNVREATLVPLRRLKHFDADPAIAATLTSGDPQLLRTAALLLKESPYSHYLFRPLMAALMRLTTEGKETSRDARLALIDAIEIHIQQNEWPELRPLLKDFDPKVARRAAELVTKLSGKDTMAEPSPPRRGWPAEFDHLKDTCVTVDMGPAGRFVLDMDWSAASITVDRFLKLAVKDHYYDGLTFHRVEPNFVIQGGSPGANEYAGHKEYMRDEISADRSHVRGSVGLSTRGRNTADGQFFINLVDNPRLDLGYTVFATVRQMDVVDKIEEGAEMRSIVLGCARPPRLK